jgi:hypothetical protein
MLTLKLTAIPSEIGLQKNEKIAKSQITDTGEGGY